MKQLLLLLVLGGLSFTGSTQSPLSIPPAWKTLPGAAFSLHYTASDSAGNAELQQMVRTGITQVEAFFGHRFPKSFDVYIFPDRAALDRQWQQDWGDSTFHSACWMVASGVGQRLDLLTPRVWKTEACDHRADDCAALQQLLTHELTHVYHGQHNPKPDFAGLDDLAWWIEGLATFASGQLDSTRVAGIKGLLQDNKAPGDLQQFWTGRHRYGLAGSAVAWIDDIFGREKLFGLLDLTKQEEIFSRLQTNEGDLLQRWKQYWAKK